MKHQKKDNKERKEDRKDKREEKSGKPSLKSWKEIDEGGLVATPGSSLLFKTGNWKTLRPVWDEKKCIHCMMCVVNCPDDAIPTKNRKRRETSLDFCKGCGICAEVCPVKCITMQK